MLRMMMAALGALLISLPALAQVEPFPAGFRTQEIATNGATIHVRVGGTEPAGTLVHRHSETPDILAAPAANHVRHHNLHCPHQLRHDPSGPSLGADIHKDHGDAPA